jgi:hypothetical protein
LNSCTICSTFCQWGHCTKERFQMYWRNNGTWSSLSSTTFLWTREPQWYELDCPATAIHDAYGHMNWNFVKWMEGNFFECLLVIIMTKPTLESEMTSTLHTLLAIIIWLYDAYCSHNLLHALMLAIPWTVKICKKLLKMMYFHLISPLGREITTGTPTHPCTIIILRSALALCNAHSSIQHVAWVGMHLPCLLIYTVLRVLYAKHWKV